MPIGPCRPAASRTAVVAASSMKQQGPNMKACEPRLQQVEINRNSSEKCPAADVETDAFPTRSMRPAVLLDGHNLIELREGLAIIKTRTGVRQTYRRKPNAPGRLLAWELVS